MADDGCGPWISDYKDPNYEAAAQAIAFVHGLTPDYIREGGFVSHVLILQVPP